MRYHAEKGGMPRFTFLQDFISAKPIKILSNTLRDKHFGGMIPMSDRRVSRPELCSRVSAVLIHP